MQGPWVERGPKRGLCFVWLMLSGGSNSFCRKRKDQGVHTDNTAVDQCSLAMLWRAESQPVTQHHPPHAWELGRDN